MQQVGSWSEDFAGSEPRVNYVSVEILRSR